jgi:hypothetical protein
MTLASPLRRLLLGRVQHSLDYRSGFHWISSFKRSPGEYLRKNKKNKKNEKQASSPERVITVAGFCVGLVALHCRLNPKP